MLTKMKMKGIDMHFVSPKRKYAKGHFQAQKSQISVFQPKVPPFDPNLELIELALLAQKLCQKLNMGP